MTCQRIVAGGPEGLDVDQSRDVGKPRRLEGAVGVVPDLEELVEQASPRIVVGAWYRYSPNRHWLFNMRLDWLSASIDNYSGDIWNVSAGVNFRATKHVGIGAAYQYFELAGSLTEPRWRGEVGMVLSGPHLFITAYW